MDVNRLSPYVRLATDAHAEADWTVPERVIYDYELLYVMEGELEVTVRDIRYEGRRGDLFLFKPGEHHAIRSVGTTPIRQPHIHFDLYYRDDSPEVRISHMLPDAMTPLERSWFRPDDVSQAPLPLPSKIQLRHPLTYEMMLFRLIREFRSKLPYADTLVKGLFLELWVYLLRENEWAHHPEIVTNLEELNMVKSYLDCHYDREVSLDTLSALSNISKYYLIGLFKKTYGMTPIKYHQLVRIEKAKEMIRYSRTPLKEIACLFGYENIHSFSRTFRQVDGVSPSYYRPRHQVDRPVE